MRNAFMLATLSGLLILSIISTSFISSTFAAQVETFQIPAGSSYTTVVNLSNGATFEGSLSISGGSGNDINFRVTDPTGNSVISQRRVQAGGDFSFQATRDGAYTLHFDNSFSLLSSKQVTLTYDIIDPIIPGGGGCLIATAAFGSELTPQVQFLRNFRDNHVLATTSGASFMSVFNSWYYSFSPAVADFEREQPLMQQAVKTAIYPLLGILQISEKAYLILPGEYGSISAGLVASSMIGAAYASPIALSIKRIRKFTLDYRIAGTIIALAVMSVFVSLAIANEIALMVTTSILVISTLSIAAILSANMITRIIAKRKAYQERKSQ